MKFLFLIILFCYYVFSTPYNTVTIDGSLNDWDEKNDVMSDNKEINDSQILPNDIKKVLVTWDKKNLYIAVDVSHNDMGMIIYFSYDETSGSKDLTEIPAWNRKVVSDKSINLFYAVWSGQRGSFYKVNNSKEVSDISWYFTYTNKNNNIYELALPWNILFPYQQTILPKNAKIHFVVCLVGGDEAGSYGYVKGDTAPDNIITYPSSTTLKNFYTIKPDQDSDGVPDDYHNVTTNINIDISSKLLVPYGKNDRTEIKVLTNTNSQLVIKILEPQTGNVVKTVVDNYLNANELKNFYWDGKDDFGKIVSQGLYIINIKVFDSKQNYVKNYPVCVIK
jgi:hypothetical protein